MLKGMLLLTERRVDRMLNVVIVVMSARTPELYHALCPWPCPCKFECDFHGLDVFHAMPAGSRNAEQVEN